MIFQFRGKITHFMRTDKVFVENFLPVIAKKQFRQSWFTLGFKKKQGKVWWFMKNLLNLQGKMTKSTLFLINKTVTNNEEDIYRNLNGRGFHILRM